MLPRRIGLAEKVAFLEQAGVYPDHPARIEAHETHLSWVFLTDTRAYKLKKPYRRGRVDYGSLAARHRHCLSEVRLNQRLAPDVYLGVLPLSVAADGSLGLGHGERVIDWLVVMRRMPDSLTLEHAIISGALREADIRRVAERLSAFFAAAAKAGFGPARYRRHFGREVESLRRILLLPEFAQPAHAVDALADRQLRFLDEERDLFDQRVRDGRIVDGHGDLRPEHIYLTPEPIILDCIEFDPVLRHRDPADELAFLSMECRMLGAPDVHHWLFDSYRSHSGDDPATRLIAFHACFNAFVRARIAVWHIGDPGTGEPEQWIVQARRYLDLAGEYAREFDRDPGRGPDSGGPGETNQRTLARPESSRR